MFEIRKVEDVMSEAWNEFERFFPSDTVQGMELVHSITGERITCVEQLIPAEAYVLRPKTCGGRPPRS